MTRTLLLLAVIACGKSPTTKATGVDLARPEGAAHCEAAAIRAKDVAAWKLCWHPLVRDVADAELHKTIAKRPTFWGDAAAFAGKLENAKASDFHMGPIPAGNEQYGSEVATLPLDKDSLELVKYTDGKWYVVDSGL